MREVAPHDRCVVCVYPSKIVVEKVVLKEIVYRVASRHQRARRDPPPRSLAWCELPLRAHDTVAFAMAGILAPYPARGWRIVAYVARGGGQRTRTFLPRLRTTRSTSSAAGLGDWVIAAGLNLLLLPRHDAVAPPVPSARVA